MSNFLTIQKPDLGILLQHMWPSVTFSLCHQTLNLRHILKFVTSPWRNRFITYHVCHFMLYDVLSRFVTCHSS